MPSRPSKNRCACMYFEAMLLRNSCKVPQVHYFNTDYNPIHNPIAYAVTGCVNCPDNDNAGTRMHLQLTTCCLNVNRNEPTQYSVAYSHTHY